MSQIRRYQDWLAANRGPVFGDYAALHRWSVDDPDGFWRSIWDYHDLESATPFRRVLGPEPMPGSVWFEGAQVNFARQVLRHAGAAEAAGQPAIVSENELGLVRHTTWPELRRQVASLAITLRELGIKRGDRVAAYLPNGPEAVIAFLACASVGAIWSLCAPDMGTQAIMNRFGQISPRALIAVDGVHYAGKPSDRSAVVRELQSALGGLCATIVLETPYRAQPVPHARSFANAVARRGDAVDRFEAEFLPFDHPLWILYSSGTTGLPKPIVHGQGGALITLLVTLKHFDVGASYEDGTLNERFHWLPRRDG